MRRVLVISAIAVVTTFSAAKPAEACSCGVLANPTRDQRLAEVGRMLDWAEVVFSGEVVATDRSSGTLAVERMWKGAPRKSVRMRHGIPLPNGGLKVNSCTMAFSSGKHLVFAKQVSPGLWEASTCAPNGAIEDRREILEFLDELCRTTAKCGGPPAGRF